MSGGIPAFDVLFSSEAKVDLLVLFRANPGIADTKEGVARRIGRNGQEISHDLDDLVELGFLKKKTSKSGMEILQLDPSNDKNIQSALDRYFRGLGDT